MYALMAISADIVHVVAMIAWAIGLPLLFWHRWPRATLAYSWYAVSFVLASQLSHVALGECFLTTLSRWLWTAAGDPTAGSFTVRLVNVVAGIRPSEQAAVLAWEIAIVVTAIGCFWALHRTRSHRVGGP